MDRVLLREVSRAYRCFETLLAGRAASLEGVATIDRFNAIDPMYGPAVRHKRISYRVREDGAANLFMF